MIPVGVVDLADESVGSVEGLESAGAGGGDEAAEAVGCGPAVGAEAELA